jgi:alkylation response protein AidB-like acyl-CoA dehydrogenase
MPPERIDIIAPHPMATVKFKDAKAADRRGRAGLQAGDAQPDVFRTTVAGALRSGSRGALADRCAREGPQDVRRGLAEYPDDAAKLADMRPGIEARYLLTLILAWKKDKTKDKTTKDAAMAKMQATEMAQEVVDAAVQLFGGLGVKSGHPVERLYREVRALRIYEGATEVQKVIIARELLK